MKLISLVVVITTLFSSVGSSENISTPPNFLAWLAEFKAEAKRRNISDNTLKRSLQGVKLLPRVIELDRRQPEFTMTFGDYFTKSVNKNRIEKGRKLLKRHQILLRKIEKRFGVEPKFLIAFWGLETNFGTFTGSFPVVSALVTLAHDRRRSRFFRKQLFAILELIEQGHFSPNVTGSWAGAMGNHQFMPTTYRGYAIDYDGDLKRDLWGSNPDIFASAANYLSKIGWVRKKGWGVEVSLPKEFRYELSGLGTNKKVAEWSKLGINLPVTNQVFDKNVDASLLLPSGYSGPAFLVFKNFKKILIWNRSIFYALAVGHLADRLVGGSPLSSKMLAREKKYSRTEIVRIQEILSSMGFDSGGADGVLGVKTRGAIKSFQKHFGLPQDGYLSLEMYEYIKNLKS